MRFHIRHANVPENRIQTFPTERLLKTILTLTALGCLCLLTTALHAQVPHLLNHRGRVALGATTFRGNSGTGVASSEPTAAVVLTVTKGLCSRPTLHSIRS